MPASSLLKKSLSPFQEPGHAVIICHHGLVLRNALEVSGLSGNLAVIVEQRLVVLGLDRAEARVLGDGCIGAGLAAHRLERAGCLRGGLLVAEPGLERSGIYHTGHAHTGTAGAHESGNFAGVAA